MDDRVQFPAGAMMGIFLFATASRPALRPTQPPIKLVPAALSLGVKRPGREADHLPPFSVEIKNSWSYTSTPPVCREERCYSAAQIASSTFSFLKRFVKIYCDGVRDSFVSVFSITVPFLPDGGVPTALITF